MFASSILLVALVALLEIGSANVPTRKETYLWSPFLRYPTGPVILPAEKLRAPQLYNSPMKIHRKLNPTGDRRYRKKQKYRWLDPIEYKKSRSAKGLNRSRRPNIIHSVNDWNYPVEDTTNSDNSGLPSVYLKPPTTNTDYRYYEEDKTSSENRIKESDRNPTIDIPKNHKLPEDSDDKDPAIYIRDHAPEQQVEASDADKETNDSEEIIPKAMSGDSKDRIEFHIQGHEGPETYIFGFDTGEGDNRQYRMEERHEDGTVTGHYGYIDARGKLRKVRYKASPTRGYEEKHHEMNEQEV